MAPETIISLVTSNVANHLKLPHKGRLRPGCDGDVFVFDGECRLRCVAANGRLLMEKGTVIVRVRSSKKSGPQRLSLQL